MYSNRNKYADRKIYENIRLHIDRYIKHKTERRFALSRSSTSFVTESRWFTPSDESRPKTRSQSKTKKFKYKAKRNLLHERSDKKNAKASSKDSSRKPGTNVKIKTLLLKKFAKLWQDSLPSAYRKDGMAKITREYQQYIQNTESAEHEQNASFDDDSESERGLSESADKESGSESE